MEVVWHFSNDIAYLSVSTLYNDNHINVARRAVSGRGWISVKYCKYVSVDITELVRLYLDPTMV